MHAAAPRYTAVLVGTVPYRCYSCAADGGMPEMLRTRARRLVANSIWHIAYIQAYEAQVTRSVSVPL